MATSIYTSSEPSVAGRPGGSPPRRKARRAPAIGGVAASLAARFPRERLDPAVLRWAVENAGRGAWSVAFSGGADSLALLLLVWAHWPERRRLLVALHFDHRLRGPESRADVTFCRRVCAALKIKFATAAWKAARAGASEAEARTARMAFLEAQGRVLWFGHQQDDIAESMLMRLARGSGAGGLAAPRPVQTMPGGRVHLRPLLTLKKQEIVAALHEAGAVWREDSSNAGDRFFRNRIRNAVLPSWAAAAQRDALAGAARSRQLLEEDDAALNAWVDQLVLGRRRGELELTVLADKPRAVCRRALHRWLMNEPRAGSISRASFDTLLNAVQAGKATRHSLGRDGFAVIHKQALRFQPAGKPR